jgi:hypothetical protein
LKKSQVEGDENHILLIDLEGWDLANPWITGALVLDTVLEET